MKIIDLSLPLEDSPSEPLRVTVEHQSHSDTAAVMAGYFGATVDDLPEKLGWANELITACSHNGTHVDAPYHYFPTCAGVSAAATHWLIDAGTRVMGIDAWGWQSG